MPPSSNIGSVNCVNKGSVNSVANHCRVHHLSESGLEACFCGQVQKSVKELHLLGLETINYCL